MVFTRKQGGFHGLCQFQGGYLFLKKGLSIFIGSRLAALKPLEALDQMFLSDPRPYINFLDNMLLMVQKSGEKTTWDGAKTLYIPEKNYQPQLVM